MKIEKLRKESFAVIGKEGSTLDSDGFIQRLWQDANAHFMQIADLAKRDEQGNLMGRWGVMSDFSRSFKPWEDYGKGLYLAGAECRDDAQPPEGWVKWIVPGYEYLRVEREEKNTFSEMLKYLSGSGIELAGAVHDFTDPQTGRDYMFFPIKKL